jgi:hypothetical protein
MDDLIKWLQNETDYFTAPASTKYHGNYEGGLAAHSLNVYDSLMVVYDQFADKGDIADPESLIIVALLHDLCKINYYVIDSEPASSAQLNYMNDLLSGRSETVSSFQRTKAYASKVIEMLKNNPEGEFPAFSPAYRVEEDMPLGHGEKSLYLAGQFIGLSLDEALAIRWHLGMHEIGTHFFYPAGGPMQQAVKQSKLVPMMIAADYLATWMVDQTI